MILHNVPFILKVPFIQWTFSWHYDMKSSEQNTIHVYFLKCNKPLWPSIYSSYRWLFLLMLRILQSITSELLLFSLVWLLWSHVGVILINELHTHKHRDSQTDTQTHRQTVSIETDTELSSNLNFNSSSTYHIHHSGTEDCYALAQKTVMLREVIL